MNYKIKTFRVNQNNQGFQLGIFKMSELRKFIRYTKRIVLYFDENNIPIYNDEIQRKLSPSKVDAIADFLIHDIDAFFPTNIVVAIPLIAINEINDITSTETEIEFNDFVLTENKKENGHIYLTIIDGQHRVAGIEKAIKRTNDTILNLENAVRTAKEPQPFEIDLKNQNALLKRLENFEIVVTFFIDPIPEYQAMVFSTINRTQTRVSEDLVYSLFGLSKNDSPQKTSLEVMLALNASEKSPLYNRIKLAGAKYKSASAPPLSQATAVKSILFQISQNIKAAEIEKNKPREYVIKNPANEYLIFRNYYGTNQDSIIIKIINNFFKAVKDTYVNDTGESYWLLDSEFNILHTTIGFQAFFSIMVDLAKKANENEKVDYQYYLNELAKAKDLDILDKNEPRKYPLTSKSINLIYNYVGVKIFGNKFTPRPTKE